MADYIEQVKIIGVVEADTSNLDAALEKYNKPIDIKIRFNGDNPFDNIQKDIKNIQSSISSINFEALNKRLSSSLEKGATDGVKAIQKNSTASINKQLDEISKAKNELQKLQNSFNGLTQGMLKSGLEKAYKSAFLLPTDQMKEAQEEIEYIENSLSKITAPNKLNNVLTDIKSSLSNIGGKEFSNVFSDYWDEAIANSKEYQTVLSQLETAQKRYSTLASQNTNDNSSISKMTQGFSEAKQSLKELDSLFTQVIGKTSKGKEITFGDSIKSTYNNLTDLNKKLSSVISNDGKDNYTIKISIDGIEDILTKIQELNTSTDSFQHNLEELNGISIFQGIESQFKEIASSITSLVNDIQLLKTSLESIGNSISPGIYNISKSMSKNAISTDEYESVQDLARNTAKNLFQSKNMEILSVETDHLESGLAKVKATVKSIEGEWQNFNATITKTGDLINQSFRAASDPVSLDKKLDQLKTRQNNSIKEIQEALDTNKLSTKISSILKNYDGYSNIELTSKGLDSQIKNIKDYMQALDALNKKSKEASKTGDKLSSDEVSEMVNKYKQLSVAMRTAENEIKSLNNAYGGLTSEQRRINASNSMLKWLEQNSRATKQYGQEVQQLANDIQTAYTKIDFDTIQGRFSNIKLDAYNKGLTGKSFTESIKNSMGTITQLFGSYSVIDRADDIAREMVSTIHDVDDALTDLKMATGVSDSEANRLMETYSQMGKTLKATGVDVATSATEWLKQGKTLSEASDLAEDAIILSKIGDLSSEESTKYLTSAMKGYKVEAEDALNIVDKLSAVDLVSATDVGGLAEGMSEVAASADLAGRILPEHIEIYGCYPK